MKKGNAYTEKLGIKCHDFKLGGRIPWSLTQQQAETTNLELIP